MTAFDNIVLCVRCGHGAGLHDGTGCNTMRCGCTLIKEAVMTESIDAMWREDRERFRTYGAKS